jgi:tetratricopeptide (TPR) repeat protein
VNRTASRFPLLWGALGALLVAALAVGALQGLAALALQRGDRAAAGGDATAAIAAYREAVGRAPWDPAARDRLAAALLDAGDYAGAIEAYHLAAALGGWSAARHTGVARALDAQGLTVEATGEYRAALALDPRDLDALLWLAPRDWDGEQWPDAEQIYGALASAPNLPAEQAGLAHYRYALLVLSSAPDVAREHLTLAGPPYARAAARLLAALDQAGGIVDPAYRGARLGVGLVEVEQYALAGRQFQQAVEINPGYAEAYAYLGLCYDHTGVDGAIYINRALVLEPDNVLARLILGYHWRDRRQWTAAREEFERALALDPRNAAAAALIGEMLVYEGKVGAAEVRLKQATELAPEEPGFWVELARYYLDVANNTRAGVTAAERASALAPDDPAALDTLGWARWLSGQSDEAARLLERAYALDATQAAAAYHLGMVYSGRGDADAARAALERAQALDPLGAYGRKAREALAQLAPPK